MQSWTHHGNIMIVDDNPDNRTRGVMASMQKHSPAQSDITIVDDNAPALRTGIRLEYDLVSIQQRLAGFALVFMIFTLGVAHD